MGWRRVLTGLLVLIVGLPALVLGGLNTGLGRQALTVVADKASGGQVRLSGLGGRFPDALRLLRLELRDAQGVWLTADGIVLDWFPTALLHRQGHIGLLSADAVSVLRQPLATPTPDAPATSASTLSLPVSVQLDRLQVARLDLAAPVAWAAASLSAVGRGTLALSTAGTFDVEVTRLDGSGRYRLAAQFDPRRLSAVVHGEEPAHGLAASLGGLPDLGPLAIDASLEGPWSAAALRLRLAGGDLRAAADGSLDLDGRAADLTLTASAPAMTPRPDLAWRAVALQARLRGTLAVPTGSAQLRIQGLSAAGAALDQATIDVTADRGQADLRASLVGLKLPGVDLFAAAPAILAAHIDLARADAVGTLTHPLLTGAFTLRRDGPFQVTLTVPELSPFAPLADLPLAGRAVLDVTGSAGSAGTTVDGTVRLGLTEGPPLALALLGPDATVSIGADMRGGDVTLRKLAATGRDVSLTGKATLVGNGLDANWALDLTNVAGLAPTLEGAIKATGSLRGPLDQFAAAADISGALALKGTPPAPLTATIRAESLPRTPTASLDAQARLGGAPVAVAARVARTADGATRLDLTEGSWRSAQLEAALQLAPGASLPQGTASARIRDLADFAPLLGVRLAGTFEGTASFTPSEARLAFQGQRLAIPGSFAANRLSLAGTVTDMAAPRIEAKLTVDGVQAGGVTGGTIRLDAAGGLQALALKLDVGAEGARASMAGRLDLPGQKFAVARFEGDWKAERLALVAPMTVSFGDVVSVDRMRLRFRQASLDIAGRASPTLDLTLALRDLPADILALAAPGLALDGSLRADARLTGRPASPDGMIRLEATGLRLRSGPGASLPAARLGASVRLSAGTASVDARGDLGTSQLTVNGTAALAGSLNLRAAGAVDLALLDAVLAAEGRRVRGRIVLDAGVTGRADAPRVTGGLTLSGGEVQDLGQGVRISEISARLSANGDRIMLDALTGRAGGGTIAATGSVGLAGAMPIVINITARNASPIQSGLVTAAIDAEVAVTGELAGAKRAAGTVRLRRAEIRIPEKLPAQVAVLNVRRPGQAAPPPAAAGPDIDLDLVLQAPGQIFVRGRGLNAELGGSLRIRGTAAQPKPDGRFTLRRGDFSLVGKTLTFSQGEVGFDGRLPIDPALDFRATSSNATTTATLAVAGTASAPRISLTAVPSVPQDEVLAQLLFSKSATQLGPVELAQIAAALAQIAGVGGGGSTLDDIRARLGLDRLSVGGAGQGKTGASVEAGRTVTEGVYVGARQSTSGNGTQATVEIDIARGLKLQADIGGSSSNSATGASGSGGTGVGLKYEFEY